jgi:N-acyl-D-amino-acid deacylase
MSFQIYRRNVFQLFGAALTAPVASSLLAKDFDLSESVDEDILKFMGDRKIPGGSIAIVKDSCLVLAKAYGWADRDNEIAARPSTTFRIASLSKPLTALGVMTLVEQGKLDLDTKFFDLLGIEPFRDTGSLFDDRIKSITVLQLLQHTGGWDRNAGYDPMFAAAEISKTLDIASPPEPKDIIRFMLGRPLDFDPGTRYCYSNFGYCILGRLIERISGMSYETYIQEKVLKPCGVITMQLGRTLHTADGEARYYMADDSKGRSVFSEVSGEVPWPYGGFCLESMDAHGGWIASAPDLARVMGAMSDWEKCPILNKDSLQTMFQPPRSPLPDQPSNFYGCGWDVRKHAGKTAFTYDHSGSLPGTMSVMFHRWDGISWIVLFNQRSEDDKLPDHDIERVVNTTLDRITDWPDGDLFEGSIGN